MSKMSGAKVQARQDPPCPHGQAGVWRGISFSSREAAVFGSDDYVVAVARAPQAEVKARKFQSGRAEGRGAPA